MSHSEKCYGSVYYSLILHDMPDYIRLHFFFSPATSGRRLEKKDLYWYWGDESWSSREDCSRDTICVSVNPPEYHLSADTEGTTAPLSVAKLSAFVTENDFSPSVCATLEQAVCTRTLSDKPVLQLRRSSLHFARPAAAFAAQSEEPLKWDPKTSVRLKCKYCQLLESVNTKVSVS